MYAMTNEDIVAPKTCQHVQTISSVQRLYL